MSLNWNELQKHCEVIFFDHKRSDEQKFNDLEQLLSQQNLDKVFVTGTYDDFIFLTSAYMALNRGDTAECLHELHKAIRFHSYNHNFQAFRHVHHFIVYTREKRKEFYVNNETQDILCT